jgi:DNA-binding SARP family transcriptional activator/tetratricopeptide (TPR) repeat protein
VRTDEPLLRLLASPRLEVGDVHFDVPDSAPGYLLAYLAARADWVRREEVATLMWPDAAESAALHNLRVNLNRLRPLLSTCGVDDALVAEQRRLRVTLPSDVAALRVAHAAGDWPAVAAIPRGGFLASLTFRAFPVLGEWARAERQRLVELWRNALLRAAPALPPARMTELARLCHEVDPLDEAVLRVLLNALVATDQRGEATAIYRRFAEHLHREHGDNPGNELQQLAKRALRWPDEAAGAGTGPPPSGASTSAGFATGLRLHPSRTVGRVDERQTLSDAARRVVLLAGDEGMGKTRLLEEVFPRACWLPCRDDWAQVPLAPVAEWLDDQREALPPLEGELRELHRLLPEGRGGEVLPVDAAGDVLPRLLEAAATLVESAAGTVVVDDAQWIDPTTARFTMLLARRARARVVVAYRPAQLNEQAARLVAALGEEIGSIALVVLRPLSAEDLGGLVANVTGVPEDRSRGPGVWLAGRCAGNPFFALEVLRALAHSASPIVCGDDWLALLGQASRQHGPSELPTRLVDLLRRRLKRLGDSTQRVLAVAAIASDFQHAGALAAAAGVSPWVLSDSLREAAEAGLVDDDHFTHDLVREAIRGAVAPSVSRLLHAQVAENFAACLPAETLAHHWWQAGDADRALASTIDAVDHARLRGLHSEVLPMLEHTLDRALESAARGRLLAATALLRQELADAVGAARDSSAALEEAIAPADRTRALVVQARLAYQAGSAGRTADLLTEAAQSNPRDADLLRLRTQLALVGGGSQELVDALRFEIAALRSEPPRTTLIVALTSLGAIHDENGEPERGLPLHQEALALARKLNARSVQVDVAINLLWCLAALPGRAADGFAIGEEALALGEYDGSDTLRNNLAWAYADVGRLPRALALYRSLTGCGDPSLVCIAWSKVVDIEPRFEDRGGAPSAAIERLLQSMERTDFYVSHASAIVAVLNHGSEEQARRAMAWLRPSQKIDPWLQEKLDTAVASRGLASGSR